MTDVGAIRWESITAIVAAFGLAVWALRDPQSARTTRAAATGPSTDVVLRFKVRLRNRPPQTLELPSGAVLGRADDCACTVDDTTVSKHHARVRYDGHAWIDDLGSTNGTYVNGRRIESDGALRRGDRIALGAAKLVFLGIGPRDAKDPRG